ncbi:MAG: DUF3225 domain-containing protein [Acidobacteria bacterium]|nr:DUF3225 domain-containing protein [Acidobacteriota bacterium]
MMWQPASDDFAIRQVLELQEAAWNRGDIDRFMQGYENSPQTLFFGAAGITRGYQAVLDNYKRRYASKEAMGKLTFTILEVRLTGADAAFVLGRFALDRTAAGGGPAQGVFSLVFRRLPVGWKIVLDHTS